MKYIYIVLPLFFIISCSKNQKDSKYIASINDVQTTLSEIDKSIEQALYDDLYHIYLLRKSAINKHLSLLAIKFSASENKISADSLVKKYLVTNHTQKAINRFIKQRNLDKTIPIIHKGELRYVDVLSTEGKKEVDKKFNEYLLDILTDSLKQIYKAKSYLQPPSPPKKNTIGLQTFQKGNIESKITFTEISNFNCPNCKRVHEVYQAIYSKYKKNIKYQFSNFSEDANPAALAAICAGNQGKFWQIHDILMTSERNLDSSEVFNIAKDMGLDMLIFTADYLEKSTKKAIMKNNEKLHELGFYATPTALINGRAIPDPTSFELISSKIEELLK